MIYGPINSDKIFVGLKVWNQERRYGGSPFIKKRKRYSPRFKVKVVLKILEEDQSLSQIASEYGLHPNQLSHWKNQFVREAAVIFRDESKPLNKLRADYDLEEYR